MDELTSDVGSTLDVGRRDLLRRGAIVVGATALWTTPIVQTLGMRPAAAEGTGTTIIRDSTLCISVAGMGEDEKSSGQPSDLVFQYTGTAAGVLVVVQRPGEPDFRRQCVQVSSGGFFTIEGPAGSNWRVGLYKPESPPTFGASKGDWKNLPKDGELLENVEFHTSCSEPLDIGDRFGSLLLVGGKANGDATAQLLEGVELPSGGAKIATSGCDAAAREGLASDDSMSTTDAVDPDAVDPDAVDPDAVDPDAVEPIEPAEPATTG